MYNLNIISYPFRYSDELIIALLGFSVFIIIVLFVFAKRIKLTSEIRTFFNRHEKLPTANYTLVFENDELYGGLPAKKISVVTKLILMVYVLLLVVTPFNEFLPTFEYKNYSYYFGFSCLFY